MDKKITRTLRYGLAAVVLILLSAIFILVQETSATSAKPSSGFGWKYDYDKLGRIASITNPANKKTKYRYTQNSRGGISSMARELPGGSRVKFKFDKYGRRTEMVDSAGIVRYVYDRFGHLARVHREGTPSITYGYDTLDRIKSISIGTQFTLQYAYDFRGRPEKITTPVGSILFSYNSKTGAVLRRLPNGILTRWVHSPDGRLESITHTSSGGRSLAQYRYAYRLDGLITSVKELTPSGVKSRRYKYDTAQRLVLASGTRQPKIEFTYDKFGNRTKLHRQDRNPISARHDWAGRLTHYDGKLIQHDPAGNLTSCTGSSKSFTFDDTGLLKTAAQKNGNINYRYDGDGYLIRRSNGAGKQTFVPDPLSDIWQPLVVKGSGGQQTFYIWDGATPLMAITGKQVRWFLHDHLGSVRLVTDRRGDIVERLDYTPFGQPERKPVGADLQPGFAGLFFDKAASVYLIRARAYDPELGRFLQPDPEHRVSFGVQEDLSQYPYCANDPVNFVDHTGARRKATGWGIMDWTSLRSDISRKQQDMRWRQDRMASDIRFPHNDTSSLRNHLTQKNWDGVATIAAQYPSPAVGAVGKFLGIATHASGLYDLRNANRTNPGDLATTARNISWGAGAIGVLATGPVGLAASGISRLIDTGVAVGQQIRSQTMQNRAIGLIGLPHGRRSQITGTQQLSSHWGSFNVEGSNFKSQGAWSLHNARGVSMSNSYANTELTNYRTSSGSLITGMQRTSDRRLERANYQEHTRNSYFSGNISFSGADFNRRYAEYERTGVFHDSFNANNFSGFNESKVGGIRLTGAGNALSHLGGLEGIALDETNDRLVLIGKGERPINLPPLRLDDVVTIFRSVYLHGEAPSVSIDPISDKKTEKWMKVRHGAATANTYVGWVLYEADRIMKTYQLGKDNRTKARFYSKIPGYRNLYKKSTGSRKTVWERFWIVPASVTGRQGTNAGLTTLDVPLRVNTERMEWRGGKFVTARDPTPTVSAREFQNWFTRNYDRIASEFRLEPPSGSGVNGRVAVFQELRRMALITAIAETLRNQNVPFPAWMRDYPVKPCKIDDKTPYLRDVERGKYLLSGGVQLAATDENVHFQKGDKKVTQLARVTQRKVAAKPLFSSVSFNQDGKTYTAVTLPGANTRRSGANILHHTDLTAQVLQETGIQLTRHFNSFYDPHGMFGRGWTLDLPRLESQRQPVSRTGNSTSYKTVYQLTSPLNSWSERFAEIRNVPEVNGQLLVPSKSETMLGLADVNNYDIGQKTKKLFFRDGRSWHFDKAGYLVARSDRKTMVIYQRDKNHRISSIKAWSLQGNRVSSGKPDAEVHLAYDDKRKRVRSIEARSPKLEKSVKALYFYDKAGQLVMVIGSESKRKYTYRDGLVASITDKDNNRIAFEYNKQGQLVVEKRADGKKVAYKRTSTSYGSKVVAMDAGSRKPLETVEYDPNFRPLRRTLEDGSNIAWKRGEKSLETTVTQPDGEYYTVTESNDGRHSTLKTSVGDVVKIRYDDKGRVTRSEREGGMTVDQKWHANGRLQSAISDEQGVLPTYTRDGKLSSVIVTPPDQARTKQIREYVKTDYDTQGRVTSVTDDSGSQLQIGYDKSGRPSEISSQRGTVTIDRDTKGQVREVGTTWGLSEKYDYDEKSGNLSLITLQQQHAGTSSEQATIELTDGLISKIRQPDGGETTLNYYQNEKQKGLLKKIHTTENLVLAYSYDNSARLTGIDIGDSNAPAYRVNYNYDKKGRLTGLSYTATSGR